MKKRLLNNQQKKLYKISQLIKDGRVDLDDLAEIIPGILHINSRKDLAIEYISKKGCDLIKYSAEELNSLGAKVLHKHQSRYTIENVYPKLFEEISKGDKNRVIPFFQDWQHSPSEKPFFLFTASKILNEEQLISISLLPKDIEHVCSKVDRLFGVNKILEIYYNKYESLTKREKEILNLLGRELSRKQISEVLFISPRTVKKHCENLFKKLGTNKRTELQTISSAFTY